ncbi:Gag-Pol polyprotein [Plecturocebus cupreus]
MGRPPDTKKDTTNLDLSTPRVQKLSHTVQQGTRRRPSCLPTKGPTAHWYNTWMTSSLPAEDRRTAGKEPRRYCNSSQRQNTKFGGKRLKFDTARSLYEALTRLEDRPLKSGNSQDVAYQKIKVLLHSALVLGLPDVTREFNLFIQENKTALRVLTQTVGPWQRPVAYLSKQLDTVASG